MKQFLTLVFFVVSLASVGQIADRIETDCDGNMRSIYQAGDEGLPLIVASKGFDCSICQSQADNVLEFAQENTGSVEVWAAMFNLYSSVTPTCENIDAWNSNYSWDESIFSFLDQDEYWQLNGAPTYYVIHPSTREIAYQGPNFSTASSTALSLGTTNTENALKGEDFRIYQSNAGIVINKPAHQKGELRIFNIIGQEVYSIMLNAETDQVLLNFFSLDGIYIAGFQGDGVQLSTKFIFKN